MGLLKFALLGIDNLAWFASIRAVGTDSKYHMRKLVMIPYWSSVRFAVIFWLVVPEFEGACLVTPALLLKLQQVVDSYHKLKEERLSKRETISDAVDKYVEENGVEALEKRIALKKQHESQNSIDYHRATKVIEAEGENIAAISKEVCQEQSISSSQVLNGTCSIANAKEITPPEVSTDDRRPQIPPLEKIQLEWTCDLCNFTTTSESMLDAHLQLSSHKSKLESLKATLLDDQDSGPSPSQPFSATSTFNHGNVEEKLITLGKLIEIMISPPLKKGDKHEWSCVLCKVKVTSEKTLIAHVLGKKHKLNANIIKIKDGVPWCTICDAKLFSHANAASHFKGKRHSSNIEKMEKLKAT